MLLTRMTQFTKYALLKKRAMIMTGRDFSAVWLLAILLAVPFAHAGRIDPDSVSVVYGTKGLQVVKRQDLADLLFEFAPFAAQRNTPVRGFSDPLGAGQDPLFRLFSGNVHHMDLLGDFHPANPFDPTEIAPTEVSLRSSYIVNAILRAGRVPNTKQLFETQTKLGYTPQSKISNTPQTAETNPLILSGFGSVSELSLPVQLHWTHCKDIDLKRFLFKKSKEVPRPVRRDTRPRLDCFVI
ncbi:MAG: hypothetical protein U5K56_01965 [Halioglobus sp.]|nr:hypothetical protein [Halioglobus sp.]